jgi:hypothetical protein
MVFFPKSAGRYPGRARTALLGGAILSSAGCEKTTVAPRDSALLAPSSGGDSNAAPVQPATPSVVTEKGADKTDRERDAGDALRVVRFRWRPPDASAEAYAMDDAEDQHRIVLPATGTEAAALPVLIAFHGQPKRGQAPRSYAFGTAVMATTRRAVAAGDVRPIVLVLPVFRYVGQNWPRFDVVAFQTEIERRLAAEGVKTNGYYVVGHSGAAGCGGDGMNRVHRMEPSAVGFFDTCLGPAWRDEVQRLREARIPTLLAHSLETAAFTPRQATEYSSTFDFGRAYGPAGLSPSACPDPLPSAPLRDQPFRCSADRQGTTQGLIIDSGEGEEGHNALVPIALEYFLKRYIGPGER